MFTLCIVFLCCKCAWACVSCAAKTIDECSKGRSWNLSFSFPMILIKCHASWKKMRIAYRVICQWTATVLFHSLLWSQSLLFMLNFVVSGNWSERERASRYNHQKVNMNIFLAKNMKISLVNVCQNSVSVYMRISMKKIIYNFAS